ncbi:hypothetical protein [Sedimentibacter sp. LTW-03]|uniref:hypothetical protein n=1 Tax=Sedimentibacter sp. LTW-03 TaxID=3453406 RepID=UPI003F8526E2
MLKYIKNEKGDSNIVGFIVVAPVLLWFFVYIIFGGSFLLDINKMTTIVNKSFDQALVEGQYTVELQQKLKSELTSYGFEEDSLEINIAPSSSRDNDNSTYEIRGKMIEVRVLYNKPHPFYYVNFKAGGESKYYIGVKIQGMSEKW